MPGVCDCPRCVKKWYRTPDGALQPGQLLNATRIREHKARAEVERLAMAQQDQVEESASEITTDDVPTYEEDEPGPEESAILLGTLRMPPEPPKDTIAVRPRDIPGDDRYQGRPGAWATCSQVDLISSRDLEQTTPAPTHGSSHQLPRPEPSTFPVPPILVDVDEDSSGSDVDEVHTFVI